ncbi:sensor histidine kinase [Tenacibaculum sp. MEBiC06402]|uniref:sensor histidine kinase n=1 Tax=unclassified Tenacibaculum TaxID=2635139 RepID=UPI003B9D7817
MINGNSEIVLDSEWEFYWNKLLSPKDFEKEISPDTIVKTQTWTHFILKNKRLPTFGYATYRLQFSMPLDRPNTSLFIPPAYSSSKIWINGRLMSEIGIVGATKETTLHRRFSKKIDLDKHESNFEIVIQVANFYHNKAGIDKDIILSETNYLEKKLRKKIIADMLFIGCLGFIGFFFLLFFFFYWNKDKAILHLGLACVCLSYMAVSSRYAPLTDVFPNISWILLTKVEYLSLFYAGTAASLFFNQIFKGFSHKLYPKILRYSFYLLATLIIVLPAPYFTEFVVPFLVFMIINILYVFFIIAKSLREKKHDSILLLVSMLLGTIVFFLHIFVFLGKIENTIIYVNFGYVIVFLMLSMLLMYRFSTSFKQLAKSRELAVNQRKEITLQSNELTKVNLELKENLKQLESSNAELDSFNHIVSHDLKAPLVAMHTLITFIEEDLELVMDENAKKHFGLLKNRVSKMDGLINGLLEYSKVAKGSKKKELFSLNNLLKDVVDILNHTKQNLIHLPDEDIQVYANRIALEHVFQNLISNAIKYNDKEKAVIEITALITDEEYVFSVSDNGPGIDTKYHSKIFEMFSRLDKDDEHSTGIGLTIVQKLVTENNGFISVESEEGQGTTIKFSWKV